MQDQDQNTHDQYQDKVSLAPARKKSRQAAGAVAVQVMRTTVSRAPRNRAAPVLSHGCDDDRTATEPASSLPTQQPTPGTPPAEASLNLENATSSPHADQGCPSIDNTSHQKGSEELEVSDSGQRTGGSVALVISGDTVSVGSLQQPRDDCQDLYQQLIVGKRSSRKPSGDEADSQRVCDRHNSKAAAAHSQPATSQALHSVLKKAKAATRTGTSAALPPQLKPRNLVVDAKPHSPAAAAAAAKRSCRTQQLPERSSAIQAKAAEFLQGRSAAATATATTRGVPGRSTAAAAKRSGHKQTPPKPPTATERYFAACPHPFLCTPRQLR